MLSRSLASIQLKELASGRLEERATSEAMHRRIQILVAGGGAGRPSLASFCAGGWLGQSMQPVLGPGFLERLLR